MIGWKQTGEIEHKEEKEKLAQKMAKRVKEGEIIGFGSGTTSYLTALAIGRKIKEEGLHIKAIPTSDAIESLCRELEIPITSLEQERPCWCFDGADEVDNHGNMIKGMGAAMFREKLNIVNSKENYILIDNSKRVKKLGEKHPIPIECEKRAVNYVLEEVKKLGAKKVKWRYIEEDMSGQREKDDIEKQLSSKFLTDNGNYILHAWFDEIPSSLEKNLKQIVGVIETGLFIGYPIHIIQ